LDDFFSSKKGKHVSLLLCRRVKKDFFDAGLIIDESKCKLNPALYLRQMGFDVDMGEGKFRVLVERWEALQSKRTRSSQPEGEGCKPESFQA
jgi:hypothetical protein